MSTNNTKKMIKNKIENPPCDVCGANTTLRYVESSGIDIQPTGLFAICIRCGRRQKVKQLNEK